MHAPMKMVWLCILGGVGGALCFEAQSMQQAGGRLLEGKNSKNEAVQQVVGAVESMSPAGRAVTGGAKDAQGVI